MTPPWKTLHFNLFIVETSVTDANSPNQDYTQLDDHIHSSLICNLLMLFKRGRQSALRPFTVELGHVIVSLLSGCHYSAGSQKKRHGHMFYQYEEAKEQ